MESCRRRFVITAVKKRIVTTPITAQASRVGHGDRDGRRIVRENERMRIDAYTKDGFPPAPTVRTQVVPLDDEREASARAEGRSTGLIEQL